MYKIGIRTDGGNKIGLGHIMRCISLAISLEKYGVQVFILTYGNSTYIEKKKIPIIDLGEKRKKPTNYLEEIKHVNKILIDYKIDALIVDHYEITSEYMESIKKNVKVLVVIDDNCVDYNVADIIINGNIYAKKELYNCHERIKYLLGNRYTLLRNEFMITTNRKINKKVKTISITTGGSDFYHLSERLIEIIASSPFFNDVIIQVIIGVMFSNSKTIEEISSKYKNVRLLYNITNMKEIMLSSDLFITTSGSTLYELAITGTPSLSLIIAKNQEKLAETMNYINCTNNMGWFNQIKDDQILNEIIKIKNSYMERKEMSEKCLSLLDGEGANRCAKEIIKSLDFIELRNASEDDCLLLFDWVNEIEVRNNFFNSSLIDYETHVKWFKSMLNSNTNKIFIGYLKNIPIGQVRATIENDIVLISYSMDKKYRGRGLGEKILNGILQKIESLDQNLSKIVGRVKYSNIASQICFEKLNFNKLEKTEYIEYFIEI